MAQRAPASPTEPGRRQASIAITGGLGGLGLLMASWAASLGGVSHILLLGRSGKLSGANSLTVAAQLQHLLASNVQVKMAAADFGAAEDMGLVWQGLGLEAAGAFDVVLHASGVLQVGNSHH